MKIKAISLKNNETKWKLSSCKGNECRLVLKLMNFFFKKYFVKFYEERKMLPQFLEETHQLHNSEIFFFSNSSLWNN